MVRYSREELEALRGDALDELPAGIDVAGMVDLCDSRVGDGQIASKKRRKRKAPGSRTRSKKRPKEQAASDSDQDGDFGGMFDDHVVFPGFGPAEEGLDGGSDDEESDGPMQKVAFVVQGEPDFDKEEPDDGWEYVRRVKWEAARCPGVKVATISAHHCADRRTHYVPVVPAIPACDPELLPAGDWEANFLHAFASVRSTFEARHPCSSQANGRPVPHMKDDSAWRALCFSNKGGGEGVPVAQELEGYGAGPLLFYRGELDLLVNLDEVSRADLLRKHVKWLQGLDYLPSERAVWLLALTAAVDKPIDAETSFALRTLLRSCASIRASKNSQDKRELAMLNMIIAIAGKYFGQDDSHCL